MHQLISKKKKIFLYFFIFFILSSINNKNLTNSFEKIPKLKSININGVESEISNQIYIDFKELIGKNLFFLDKENLENKLKNYKLIEEYSVKKIYPSEISINLKKTKFVGKTIQKNKKYYITTNGYLISTKDYDLIENIPNVFGNFEIRKFLKLLLMLESVGINNKLITNAYYFESGRWDIKLDKDLLIKLPSSNVSQSIELAKQIINDDDIKKKIIDLRVSNQVIIFDE